MFDTWLIRVIGPVYDPQSVFFRTEKKCFIQIDSVLHTKNRSEPAKKSVFSSPAIGHH